MSVALTVPSLASNGFATWLSIACARAPEESYHAVPDTLAVNFSTGGEESSQVPMRGAATSVRSVGRPAFANRSAR